MGILVCAGATCKCQFGDKEATLEVTTSPDHYVNDSNGESKLTASTKDIGTPFKEKTFGKCSKQGNPPPPCKPDITKWEGFYDKVTLKNGGKILLDSSKAICSISGAPSIEITYHGQNQETTSEDVAEIESEEMNIINPMMDLDTFKPNYKYDAK